MKKVAHYNGFASRIREQDPEFANKYIYTVTTSTYIDNIMS